MRGVFHQAYALQTDAAGSGTVAAVVRYLLNREAGARVEALFLTALADGDFSPVDLTGEDYRRAAELVTT